MSKLTKHQKVILSQLADIHALLLSVAEEGLYLRSKIGGRDIKELHAEFKARKKKYSEEIVTQCISLSEQEGEGHTPDAGFFPRGFSDS